MANFNVLDYGAAGNITTDDTVAIQATIDAAAASVVANSCGATVYFPAGRYLVSSTLRIQTHGVCLEGPGPIQTIIYRKTDFGDTVYIAPPSVATGTYQTGNNVKGLGFYHDGPIATPTHGAALHFAVCSQFVVDEVTCTDHYGGVRVQSCNVGVIFDKLLIYAGFNPWAIKQANSYLMMFQEEPTTLVYKPPSELFVSNFNFRGANGLVDLGIVIQGGDGLWFSNGHVGDVQIAECQVQPGAAGVTVQSLMFSNVYFDGFFTNATGLRMLPGATINNVQFGNCVFKNHTGSGVHASPGAGHSFRFSNCEFSNNGTHGAWITGCDDWGFTGCYFRDNNGQNIGAVALLIENAVFVSVTGCHIRQMIAPVGVSFLGSNDYVSVTGNTLNNPGGRDVVGFAGAHSVMANNVGYSV